MAFSMGVLAMLKPRDAEGFATMFLKHDPCVGGDSNVPLGFVSLTENLMMIAMARWMAAHL